MKDEHGQAHSGLRDRPTIQDAGTSPHPAIATDQSPNVYDPRRAAGAKAARANAADDGVFISPPQALSSPARRKESREMTEKKRLTHGRRLQERSIAGQARQSHRNYIADEYLTGRQTMRALAQEHGISVFTVRDFVRDRRESFLTHPHLRPTDVVDRREVQSNAAIAVGAYGTGGAVSDDAVRRATRMLEREIVKGLALRGLAPLPYHREVKA